MAWKDCRSYPLLDPFFAAHVTGHGLLASAAIAALETAADTLTDLHLRILHTRPGVRYSLMPLPKKTP